MRIQVEFDLLARLNVLSENGGGIRLRPGVGTDSQTTPRLGRPVREESQVRRENMAVLVIYFDGEAVFEHALSGPITIGRSPECDLSVRDVRLSRRHCRVEPLGKDWIIADLDSKNGIALDGKPISMRVMQDGDELKMGRTKLVFHVGDTAPARPAEPSDQMEKSGRSKRRPVDPLEALSSTIIEDSPLVSFPRPSPVRRVEHFPTPNPRPRDPDAYIRDGVYSMVQDLISSSWDSIYSSNSRQAAVMVVGTEGRAPNTATAPVEAPAAKPEPNAPKPRRQRSQMTQAALDLQVAASEHDTAVEPPRMPSIEMEVASPASSWLGRWWDRLRSLFTRRQVQRPI